MDDLIRPREHRGRDRQAEGLRRFHPESRTHGHGERQSHGPDEGRHHEERDRVFAAEIEAVRGRPEWPGVPPDMQQLLLGPVVARACGGLERPDGEVVCRTCRATVPQMESDLAAASGLRAEVLARVQELVRPEERVERVRPPELLQEPLESEESVRLSLPFNHPGARGGAADGGRSNPPRGGRRQRARVLRIPRLMWGIHAAAGGEKPWPPAKPLGRSRQCGRDTRPIGETLRGSARVAMMEAADQGRRDDLAPVGRLHPAGLRGVLAESQGSPGLVVVREIGA